MTKKSAKQQVVSHSAKDLGLNKQALPHSIVEVVATLQKAGFVAYIVGGGVRDSFLGLAPKDFDAVTNARPQEIKQVFGSRCRIIGKRFMLAHVYSGRELIEVATFRAPPKDDNTTDGGMIVRDNAWGDIYQDFERRDFSINALYYDPIKGVVLDFCGALDDINSRTLRLLGKPTIRIEEDPVRLLRALRFMAKLNFAPNAGLAKQFNKKNWELLEQVSTHRLYDETTKMFGGGYLSSLLPLLYQYGAMGHLLDNADKMPSNLAIYVAKTTDERLAKGLGANPAFFYATLLWDNYLQNLAKFKKKLSFYEAQLKAATRTLDRQRIKTAVPKFAEEFITQIWLLQSRLVGVRAKEVVNVFKHPNFRPAYDFLLAREQADDEMLAEPTNGMGAWWTHFVLSDEQGKLTMLNKLDKGDKSSMSQTDAEKWQLGQLTLDNNKSHIAKPLFGQAFEQGFDPSFEQGTSHSPRRRRARSDVSLPTAPIFAKVAYSDEDFMRLLADDVKVPAFRKHKKFKVADLK